MTQKDTHTKHRAKAIPKLKYFSLKNNRCKNHDQSIASTSAIIPVGGITAIRKSIKATVHPPTTRKGSINPPAYR